ncbi:hypothetical protein Lal_00007328 [Lupinus albus]|uniref:Putative bromodomain associated domain-containing protein n=1 Tax=Lupinus albus TaxID=3870 RepID=A0A6A4P2V7_LUPAL|nr:putative bromodomain associated domain-containing protein [Lupinus albus]KAF1874714.1 hypothetical protein Lal_00007328 [Lupinus albus]
MNLLGEDGKGYELAMKLESFGLWRTWLGDSTYPNFIPFLSSLSAWDSFITPDPTKSRALIQLQLRVRALLFDKASVSLFTSSNISLSPSSLNPPYLQLHADDVYYTLENDGVQAATTSSKNQSKTASGARSRYVDSELDSMSQRYRNGELPETWYDQFIDKYKANKKLILGDRDSQQRSPMEMASYLTHTLSHKRRRLPFKEDQHAGFGNSVTEHASAVQQNGGNLVDDDSPIFPEIMYTFNCVPETALTPTNRVEINPKLKLYGVLDTLPPVTSRSPVMLERLGIRPEYLNMEHAGSLSRGKFGPEGNRELLCLEQASKVSQKVVARVLTGVGFEASMEAPIELFSDVLSDHIYDLGKKLKVLTDSYRKQCSAIELLKMFLTTLGFSNFAPLMNVVKDGSKNSAPQIQPQVQPQQQSSLQLHPQVQVQRQIHPQMQQIIQSHNLAFQQQQQQQQQLERIRRRPASTPRPAMDIDKERPLIQVKLENPSDILPSDGNAFNSRHSQMQFRQQQQQQQQMASMSNFHSQSSTQFRQMGSLQIPSVQSPNTGVVRAPPVKVEGFSELMGGDSSVKHDSEENRLTSPTSK